MFNKVERIISLRNLRPKKKEGFLKIVSIFSFLGIMLGVTILIVVMSVMNGFRTELTNKVIGFNPHIVIKPYSQPISENFKKNLKEKYKSFEIVNSFSGEGVILMENNVKGILVKGVDTRNKNNLRFIKENLIDGKYKNFNVGKTIIGKELAINLNVVVGDKVNLMSSAFINTPLGGVPKQESYEVAAIFSSGFFEFDQNVVFLNLNDSLSLFDTTDKELSVEINLKNPLEADSYKKEIEKLNENFYVFSWSDLNKSFFTALKMERNIMFIILTLIIIVAAFNIISGLTILIKNKTKEIAIFKTLGLSSNSIIKSFFLTGFTIGFLASVTGVILGVVLSFFIEDIRFFVSSTFNLEIFPADIYFLDELPSEINPISIFIIFIFSIFTTALASFFPAKAISKMKVTTALKYE